MSHGSQLEEFINALNVIQTNGEDVVGDKYEQLAEYLLRGKGWTVLTAVYTRKIQLNGIIGEKLIDVLLHTCGQLLQSLPTQLAAPLSTDLRQAYQHLLAYFDELTFEQLNQLSSRGVAYNLDNKFSLRMPQVDNARSVTEGLLYFSVICLELFLRFNDGTANSVLVNSSAKTNSLFVLNEFCEILFNKLEKDSELITQYLQIIYIKFLNKLFTLNFKNYHSNNSNSANTAGPKLLSSNSSNKHNSLFLAQFKLITGNKNSLTSAQQSGICPYFVRTCIEYCYNYCVCINLITFSVLDTEHRQKVSTLRMAYYANINVLLFRNVLQLVHETAGFVLANIHQLEGGEVTVELAELRDSSSYWRKISECLLEMKLFKNYQEHAETCLRAKHSHATCKAHFAEVNTKHNNLTLQPIIDDESSFNKKVCVFADVNRHLFANLVRLQEQSSSTINCQRSFLIKQNRVRHLIEKFGLCTCLRLEELFEMHRLKTVKAEEDLYKDCGRFCFEEYYFSRDLCTTVGEFLVQISGSGWQELAAPVGESRSSTGSASGLGGRRTTLASSKIIVSQQQRRSTFFPLFLEETLKNNSRTTTRTTSISGSTNPTVHDSNGFNSSVFLVKDSADIILELSERSVLLCKYFASILLKYSQILQALSSDTHSNNSQNKNTNTDNQTATQTLSHTKQIQLKAIIYEVFYLFAGVLKSFALNNFNGEEDYGNGVSSDEETECLPTSRSKKQTENTTQLIFEIICKYMNDFLTLYRLVGNTETDSKSSSNNKIKDNQDRASIAASPTVLTVSEPISQSRDLTTTTTKLSESFTEFLADNSTSLFQDITQICGQFYAKTSILCMSIGSQLILFRESPQKVSIQKTTIIEAYLSQALIDIVASTKATRFYDDLALDVVLELFIKSEGFRLALADVEPNFHEKLVQCLRQYFLASHNDDDNGKAKDGKYLELLLDLTLVYFYFNRKKDLADIYRLLKDQLPAKPDLLLTYLNVTILSKACKLNKLLLLDDLSVECESKQSSSASSSPTHELSSSSKSSKPRRSTTTSTNTAFDYDADTELNWTGLLDSDEDPCDSDRYRVDLNGFTTHSSFRYDVILFPKLLEICLNHVLESNKSMEPIPEELTIIFEQFFKRFVYLLETCNFNIHILINSGLRQSIVQLIPFKTGEKLQWDQKTMRPVFDLLYYMCLYDMNEDFLLQLFELLINDSDSSSTHPLRELASALLVRLSKNLPMMQSTHFLRMPYQNNLEPMEYLVRTSCSKRRGSRTGSKWNVNLEYESPKKPEVGTESCFGTPIKLLNQSPNTPRGSFDSPVISHLEQMINESGQSFASLKIPLNVHSMSNKAKATQTHSDLTGRTNSHSLAFMLRFDNNLLNFSKSYGLCDNNINNKNNKQTTNNHSSSDSYVHLLTLKFGSSNSDTAVNNCFELWLNPAGSILFLRRTGRVILFTLNLMQLDSNVWQFVHVGYEEIEMAGSNNIMCNLSYSLNASELFYKEFEIQANASNPLYKNGKSSEAESRGNNNNSCLFLGHEERKRKDTLSFLFHYDLGQVVLSKDAAYSLEHLLVLMHVMDTNVSQLDCLARYEWAYLNGYSRPEHVESLQKDFQELANQIKIHINVVYHPRNPHVYAIKPSNCKLALTYVELITSARPRQQCTLDIVLAKVGGIRQLLVLLAKLVESENKNFTVQQQHTRRNSPFALEPPSAAQALCPSLNILQALINLINKRPSIEDDFRRMDGYALLQRIYTSMAGLNLYQTTAAATAKSYYASVQVELFTILINGCFRHAVVCANIYIKERVELCCKSTSPHSQTGKSKLKSNFNPNSSTFERSDQLQQMHLVNGNLLAHVLIEWILWQSFAASNLNLWQMIFRVLDCLLENNPAAQLFHSNVFIRFNIIEKLMHFLLDANEEQFVFAENSCLSLINIFKHFNSINSNNIKTKELFASFFEYLHVLHPENRAYIVYATNHFYYNLTICLPSVPVSSLQEYKEVQQLEETSPTSAVSDTVPTGPTTSTTIPATTNTSQQQQGLHQKLPINLDRFQTTAENEANFQQISASLMEIMHDMLTVLPDHLIHEILNMLKYESFIMFAMDENPSKRFEAFRIFLALIERSSASSLLITSSIQSIVSAASTVTTNLANSASPQSAFRSFEQQNFAWSVKKEQLIYAMCNQLNQFDQLEPRFPEFCIGMLIGQPFQFKYQPDEHFLKSIGPTVGARSHYMPLIVSFLYSCRKNYQLCQQCMGFVTKMLRLELVRVDFVISKCGLLQVLFNLLRYFSEMSSATAVASLITDMKQLFSLITRLLIRYNQVQDLDNFSYYLNSIVSLCYDSANIGYEAFNLNLKAIVLNIVQSIMSDLNSISAIAANGVNNAKFGGTKSSTLLKKIIMPLISPQQQQQQNQQSNSSSPQSTDNTNDGYDTVFDSDFKFQKFIVFLVDFIHIIYDKISDMPIQSSENISKSYDQNDELAIFSFSILIHSLSMGLEANTNNRTRFSAFFRTNLLLIRSQFRRMLIFLMHPNHKFHTRLQLIKRLLNTSNCELILKCILAEQPDTDSNQESQISGSGAVSFNAKLAFYLNALMNSGNGGGGVLHNNSSVRPSQISNNDKEILIHLDEIVTQAGLDYKSELSKTIQAFSKMNFSSNFFLHDVYDQQWQIFSHAQDSQHDSQLTIDLLNQCDKEFDEEIIKIYHRTNQTFKRFLRQYERLTEELNEYAVNLTNQVCAMHSNVRKSYLQRLKNKRIHRFDIKQKWLRLIDNMTHEKCLWHEPASAASTFYILDQTEGLNRERRRLKKSHLYIPERFFKDEYQQALRNEQHAGPLRYLLANYDVATDGSVTNSTSMSTGDYMLYYLKNSEVLKYPCSCKNVMPYCEIKGELLLSESRIYFAADEKEYANLMGIENVSYSWSYDDVREIHLRRYLLKDIGFELFLGYGSTILLAFDSTQERNSIYKFVQTKLKHLVKSESIDEATSLWRESKISNFEYLMQLNKYSGRTFNDLMQYPVFPHILANYASPTLDMLSPDNYRELARPIAIQNRERESKFLQTYSMLRESSDEAYHYASLYSNSGTVLHYLVRLPPFTKMFLDYQDNNFDAPDRTFHSMNTSWLLSSTESSTDYKELIPEFFFLHEFLTNRCGFNFGLRQSGEDIDCVTLPAWCQNKPRLFVQIMRQALESTYVTANLNLWIDLIFGYKQNGSRALESINCYHPACYFGYPVEQITDTVHRKAIETMIKTWGQTPKQLFTSSPHPQASRKLASNTSNNSHTKFDSTTSIHRLVHNVKWGSYVGSLDQALSPVCVHREHCKRNIVQLVALASNDVIGLSQHKCLLLDRASTAQDTLFMALVEWAFNDDYIKTKSDGQDKPLVNLLPIRANEHIVVSCCCIGSSYLVLGEKSGLLSVYKLKKAKNSVQNDGFHCHLYGHRYEITDMSVCLAYSTMVTASQDGLLIIWDTNKLSFVGSIKREQPIYKVVISETTNDIAFIANSPNSLCFYTGNCELIGEASTVATGDGADSVAAFSTSSASIVTMKSLCFSNHTEGLNVNVIAVGLSNGRIHLYSTWDLTLLREITITEPPSSASYNSNNNSSVGCIISLTFTRDRLYAADTYARVYILESAYAPASLAKNGFSIAGQHINSSISSGYLTNLICFS